MFGDDKFTDFIISIGLDVIQHNTEVFPYSVMLEQFQKHHLFFRLYQAVSFSTMIWFLILQTFTIYSSHN